MAPKLIIGLSGKKRVGKDTAAQVMQDALERNGLAVERIAFADKLREIVWAANPELVGNETKSLSQLVDLYVETADVDDIREGFERVKETSFYRHMRNLMQDMGDVIRDGDPHYFVTSVRKRIERSEADVVIITDIRFQEELNLITDMGGTTIHIERPEVNDGDTHISETFTPDTKNTHHIRNEGTKEEFIQQVKKHTHEISSKLIKERQAEEARPLEELNNNK